MKKIIFLLLLVLLLVSLTGCIPGNGSYTAHKPAGFFWGVWHGWIAPVSLVLGFFNRELRIYEPMNTGWFYDLGFYMAVVGGFGGLSLARSKNKEKRKEHH